LFFCLIIYIILNMYEKSSSCIWKLFWLISIIIYLLILLSLGCGGGGGGSSSSSSGNGSGTFSSATLTWYPPRTNADGAPLTDLGGYKVYYGISCGNYTNMKFVETAYCKDTGGKTECTFIVEGLEPGTYYFAVTAYNSFGIESDFSNEVNKTVN
jgi:hypothetical protein